MPRNPNLVSKLSCIMGSALLLSGAAVVSAQVPAQVKIEMLKRAVVLVTTEDKFGKPLLQGSGFFVAPERIVTASHVLKGAARIRIKTIDGQTRIAQNVIAADEKSDLALLQVEALADTSILQLADSAPAEGEAIVVLSNPQGFPWKVTRGRVGLSWEFGTFGERMQVSASILPGSSGGPVINAQGRVVGIADLHILGPDDLNFAVPTASLKALQATPSVAGYSRPVTRR